MTSSPSPPWPATNRAWTVAIAGFGLMGASLGLALKTRWPRLRLLVLDRPAIGRKATEAGLADFAAPLRQLQTELARHAPELVVLALPLPMIVDALPVVADASRALPASRRPLVLDLGSSKQTVMDAAIACGCPRFVGGHPMAGSERQGFAHADPTLFANRPFVLCRETQPSRRDQQRAEALVRAVNGEPMWLSASAHDDAVAVVSHLPHLCAFTLLETARRMGQGGQLRTLERLAAGSWRDATRVGAADPQQWTSIFFHNRAALVRSLDTWLDVLRTVREHLQSTEDVGSFELGFDLTPLSRTRRRWTP